MGDTSPTRRQVLRFGGLVALTGVAGCSSGGTDSDGGKTTPTSADSTATTTGSGTTPTEGATPTETATSTPTASFSPAGKIVAGDGSEGDRFGARVAIDGGTALVTATWDKDRQGKAQGTAYVFEQSGGGWNQAAKFTAAVGEQDLDGFGFSASLLGDTALVGAATYDPNGPNSGAAYVFGRSNGGWSRQAELTANDADKRDLFGVTTALTDGGDRALVGSGRDEDPNGERAGSAYVFQRSGGSWSQQAKLAPGDGDSKDGFGGSVALAGTTALVGASGDEDANGEKAGAAYVFDGSGSGWSQTAKLAAGDSEDGFGGSVALSASADTALVAAPTDEDPNGGSAGAAYVFERSGGNWSRTAKLAADDGDSDDFFGGAVALTGDTALVGANGDEDPGADGAGSAYVFQRFGGSWNQTAKLSADDGGNFDRFGTSVALTGNAALVGANFDDNSNGKDAGAAYSFER